MAEWILGRKAARGMHPDMPLWLRAKSCESEVFNRIQLHTKLDLACRNANDVFENTCFIHCLQNCSKIADNQFSLFLFFAKYCLEKNFFFFLLNTDLGRIFRNQKME